MLYHTHACPGRLPGIGSFVPNNTTACLSLSFLRRSRVNTTTSFGIVFEDAEWVRVRDSLVGIATASSRLVPLTV